MATMIVAPEPLAAQAGIEAVRRGGNVIDGAVAAALVQAVVNPFHTGIGGTGTFFASTGGGPFVIDCSATIGRRPVPQQWSHQAGGRSETFGRYMVDGDPNQSSYPSIMTPGMLAGCHEAHARFGSGKITWADLISPAVVYASEGFTVYPYIAEHWLDTVDRPGYPCLASKLAAHPAAAAIYLTSRGKACDQLVQADYGRTLLAIAEHGAGEFYQGRIGDLIAADLDANGSLVTRDDLAGYEVSDGLVVFGRYRGHDLAAPGGFASGTQVLEMLHILDLFEVGKMEHNGPEYADLMARIMRAGFFDNVLLKGDPPFSVGHRLTQRFLSSSHAQSWHDRIAAGDPVQAPAAAAPSHTTHVTAVDDRGTIACFTTSIGSLAGSGTVTPGLGFLYNNYLGHFNPRPGRWDSIVAGKRGIGGAPVIVSKRGRPVLALGAPGGSRLITSVFQTIVNVLDFGMTAAEAVSAPRLHSEQDTLVFVEPSFPKVEEFLTGSGHRVMRAPDISTVHAIAIDPAGRLCGGPDPRGGGGCACCE